jgi:hypothetical protein
MADLFALQDEITEHVVAAIEPAMLDTEASRVARKSLADLSALDCFQRGMWHFNRMSAGDYHQALALFRQAIARDPALSLGYVGLARMLYGGAIYGWSRARRRAGRSRSIRATPMATSPGPAPRFTWESTKRPWTRRSGRWRSIRTSRSGISGWDRC